MHGRESIVLGSNFQNYFIENYTENIFILKPNARNSYYNFFLFELLAFRPMVKAFNACLAGNRFMPFEGQKLNLYDEVGE